MPFRFDPGSKTAAARSAQTLFSALLLASALAGCGSSQTPGAQNAGDAMASPGAPNVDLSQCDEKGKQVVTSDTNNDKKPDVWKLYTSGAGNAQILTCDQKDLNHDGKIDEVLFYDPTGQNIILEKFDLDFDGKLEQTTYRVSGKKVRVEQDTNWDGRPDVWKYYEDEKLVRLERDGNFDGKVDEWQFYEGGRLDRIGYDTTGSGRVDKWDRAPEGDDGLNPSSTAAAAPAAAAPAAPAPGTAPPASDTAPTTPPAPTAPAPAGVAPAASATAPAAAKK